MNKLKYSGVKLILAVIVGTTVWLSIALGFFLGCYQNRKTCMGSITP